MKINKRQIRAQILASKQRIENAVLLNLERIGEQFIANARNTDTYKDRTGNLRSSIGYVILKNGLQKTSSGWSVVKNGKAGQAAGQKLINELAKKYPTGLVLICVAGMEYAAYVEAKGFDVITSSSIIAKDSFNAAIERIKKKLSQTT